jgi:hypothetical protein
MGDPNNLNTSSKEIVGAINETKSQIEQIVTTPISGTAAAEEVVAARGSFHTSLPARLDYMDSAIAGAAQEISEVQEELLADLDAAALDLNSTDDIMGIIKIRGASTAASASGNAITDSTKSWIPYNLIGQRVTFKVGNNIYNRTISDNTATTISFSSVGVAIPSGTLYWISISQVAKDLDTRNTNNTSQISQLAALRNHKTVYGASWDKTSSPTLTRTDLAVGLTVSQLEAMSIVNDIVDVVDSYGNVFVRIPSFYIKKTIGTTDTVQISRTYKAGYYLPWCFWDFTKGRALPYVDIGKYTASSDDGVKLESKSGKYPLTNKTIVQCRTMAQANNTTDIKGYQQFDIHAHDMITALISVVYGTLNSQSIAQGWSAGNYSETDLSTVAETGVNRVIVSNATAAKYAVGQPIGLGTTRGGNQIFGARDITAIETYDASNKAIVFDGAAVNVPLNAVLYNIGWKSGACDGLFTGSAGTNNGKFPMTIFGIENLWGNVFQFVDGVNITDRQAWVCENADNYASNVFAAPYKQLSYVNGADNGYITQLGFDTINPYARLPIAIGGSASTYYSDYYYQSTGARIALFGGYWRNGSGDGLRCWYLIFSSSDASPFFSARLLKKPL